MRTTARQAIAVATASALLPLAGCGLSADDPNAERHAAVTGVRQAVHDTGSVTVDFEVSLGPLNSRDGAHWEGTVRQRYGDRPASEIEYASFSVRGAADPTAPGALRVIDLHEIALGTVRRESVRYHRSETLQAPADRPWVRLEPGEHLAYGPAIADPDLGVVDPEWYLALLASVDAATAYLSATDRREEIDGVTTDVYRISCALASEGCPYPDHDDPLRRMFPDYNPVTVTVWVDGEGRPRRLAADLEFHVEGSGGPLGGSGYAYRAQATMSFRDFGEPVDIPPPPPEDDVSEWPPAA